MDIIKPRTLSGFMELLPAKQARLERMMDILRRTYASYGFAALDTPAIDLITSRKYCTNLEIRFISKNLIFYEMIQI